MLYNHQKTINQLAFGNSQLFVGPKNSTGDAAQGLPGRDVSRFMVIDGGLRTRSGQCHCGSGRFDAELSDGFNTIRRCTGSYWRIRVAIAVSATLAGIRFVPGKDIQTRFRFNAGQTQHFFCSRCGVYTHTNGASIRMSTASTPPAWTG